MKVNRDGSTTYVRTRPALGVIRPDYKMSSETKYINNMTRCIKDIFI